MKWIKESLRNGDLLAGTFLSLGAGCVAEIAGRAGLDWVLIDTEHGLGDHQSLVSTLQAARVGSIPAMVRVAANESQYFKQALDLGATGIMVPQINTPEEARQAVMYTKYPPEGTRGLTRSSWASGFGFEVEEYLAQANRNVLLAIQIETKTALDHVDQIAAIDGVDVLFVGPSDLSCNLSIPCDLDHPDLTKALSKVSKAAYRQNKKTGILIRNPKDLEKVISAGFQLIALGTDLSILKTGLQKITNSFQTYKRSPKKGV